MFGKQDHKAVAIIPARLGSTRFPRKALADDTGKPMVVHVCEQAAKAESVSRVVVATDAEEIKSAVESHGFEAVMTSVDHTNGTSRLAEATGILNLKKSQIVINVQGDEPEIECDSINAAFCALSPLGKLGGKLVGTVVSPINSKEEFENPNIVKAIMTGKMKTFGASDEPVYYGRALYFSRSPVPYPRTEPTDRANRHVGIYAYSVQSINAYHLWKPSSLELTESLEQLRWLTRNYTIFAAYTNSYHTGIDTPEQYRAFVDRYQAAQSP